MVVETDGFGGLRIHPLLNQTIRQRRQIQDVQDALEVVFGEVRQEQRRHLGRVRGRDVGFDYLLLQPLIFLLERLYLLLQLLDLAFGEVTSSPSPTRPQSLKKNLMEHH